MLNKKPECNENEYNHYYDRFLRTGKINDYLSYKGYQQVYFIDPSDKENINRNDSKN